MRVQRLETWESRPGTVRFAVRDMDGVDFESRARTRRVPVAMMVIFIMFLTMGFDLESDWLAGQRQARYRYSQGLLYEGQSVTNSFSNQLDQIEQRHEIVGSLNTVLGSPNRTETGEAGNAGVDGAAAGGGGEDAGENEDVFTDKKPLNSNMSLPIHLSQLMNPDITPGVESEGSNQDGNNKEFAATLDDEALVSDVAKSYRGRWCIESINDEIDLYPDVFNTKCGALAMKVTTGIERRTNSTLTYATMVLQDDNRKHEMTVKMHGEYKTHKKHLLLVGSLRDMFMKNSEPQDPKARGLVSPYSPCKIETYIKVRNASPDGELNGGMDNSTLETIIYDEDEDVSSLNLLSLNGEMGSENCQWRLHLNATSLNMDRTISKVTNYCFMMVSLAILQLVCLVHQVQQVANPGVSLMSLGQQAMIDAYLCLLHLTAGIVADSMFSALATAAFCEFVVFSMFEMRYLVACSHSRLGNQNSWLEAQADIGTIYGRFYGLLLAGIVLVYEFKDSYWVFTFAFYSFWIPQIVRNAVHAYRRPLKPLFIIGMSLCRLVLPLYFFGCPKNFLKVPYNPQLCISLTFYVFAQAGLLLLQYYKGSRCFIPKIFLPEQYNYYRKLNKVENSEIQAKVQEEGGLDCVICMQDMSDIYSCPSKRMVTPCNHFFHPECLERWLKVKMECPTCRRVLPPTEY